jgi:AraC-like DNA-binding protein
MRLRRLELDKAFSDRIVDKRIPQKDSMLYTIAPHAGKGTLRSFQVMPGVEMIYNDCELHIPFSRAINLDMDCLEITYCLKGQMEVELRNRKCAYMTDGDVSLFGYRAEVVSCDLSLKPFTGVTVMVYLPEITHSLNTMLGSNEFTPDTFFKDVFDSDTCVIKHASQSVEHIFKELFVLPDPYRNYLMKLKVIELLLYLMIDTDYRENETVYFPKSSADKIKAARRFILRNIDRHITIRELSRNVGMNVTDLEKGFKHVYGHTVFAYGKQCKMQKARELLSDNTLSILDVALACGYGNAGRFANVFREAFGITPLHYRKDKSNARSMGVDI